MTGLLQQSVVAQLHMWTSLQIYLAYAHPHAGISLIDWKRCDTSENAFLNLWTISFNSCVVECNKRPSCKALNFHLARRQCELLRTDLHNQIDNGKRPCVFVRKKHTIAPISVENQCQSCSAGTTCQLPSGNCVITECEIFALSSGVVQGNMKTIGATLKTIPDPGYTLGSQSARSVCQSNGNWDNIPVLELVDCGQPATLSYSTITDGNTVYGSTKTYACAEGYDVSPDSSDTSVTCEASGNWSQTGFECVEGSPCDSGWHYAESTGSCYYGSEQTMIQEDAKSFCSDFGAHLVYLENEEESNLVIEYLRQTYDVTIHKAWWIGLERSGDVFVYIDTGVQTNYVNWHPGQPDNYNDNDNCVEINFVLTGWNDCRCNAYKRPICEKASD